MVKGVNKTVIEVNNTGSRYFEKIVFYVTPQYGNLSAKQLKKAASNFSFNFESLPQKNGLRNLHKWRKIKRVLLYGGATLAIIVSSLFLFF